MSEAHMIVMTMKLSVERQRLAAAAKAYLDSFERCCDLLDEVTKECREAIDEADRRIDEIKRISTLTPAERA